MDSTPNRKGVRICSGVTERVHRSTGPSTNPCPRSIDPVDRDQSRAACASQSSVSVDRSFVMVDRAVDRAMPVHIVHTDRPGGRPSSWPAASPVLALFGFRSLRYLPDEFKKLFRCLFISSIFFLPTERERELKKDGLRYWIS